MTYQETARGGRAFADYRAAGAVGGAEEAAAAHGVDADDVELAVIDTAELTEMES